MSDPQDRLSKLANVVTILSLPLALLVFAFGDNVFEQITGRSFIGFFRDYSISAIGKALMGTCCIFFMIGFLSTVISRLQPDSRDSSVLTTLGIGSLVGASILFVLFLTASSK
jgi:hypothetical protein